MRVTNISTIVSVCWCGWIGPPQASREPYPRIGGNSFPAYLDWVMHVTGQEVTAPEPDIISNDWITKFLPKGDRS